MSNVEQLTDTIQVTFQGQNLNFDQSHYTRVFSFSLFISKQHIYDAWEWLKHYGNANPQISTLHLTDPAFAELNNWVSRYFLGQANAFQTLCTRFPNFSILHFVEDRMLSLPLLTMESNGMHCHFKKTVQQALLENAISNHFPYRLYGYSIPNFEIIDKYYGTVVRFAALRFNNIEIVLFRDAHTTLPCNTTSYDLEWCDTWYKSNKRFWMYTAPWYNPTHGSGEHLPFAATWGARNLHFKPNNANNGSCFSDEEWQRTFGKLKQYHDGAFWSKSNYGVDERLFHEVLIDPIFQNNFYFVGITWLGYLFYNPPDMDEFERYDPSDPTKTVYKSGNQQFYKRNHANHFNSMLTYYGTIKCLALDTIRDVANLLQKPQRQVTANDFFNYVESKQRNEPYSVYARLPSRYHVWEYIFQWPAFNPDVSLLDYLNDFSKHGLSNHPKEILEKVCDNSLFQFIGDDFQPSKNIYSQDTLSFISLPEHHPLKYLHPAPQNQQQQIPSPQNQQQQDVEDPFLIDDPNLFSKHFAPRIKN